MPTFVCLRYMAVLDMNKFYFSLWGMWVLHTLIALTYLLFSALLPSTGDGLLSNGWVFLLFIVLFAINLFLNFLAAFWLTGADFLDSYAFAFIPLALLGMMLAPPIVDDWLYYRQYTTAPLVRLDARAPRLPQHFALYDLAKDSAMLAYLLSGEIKRTYTPTKSNQTRTYTVPCEIVPFVPHTRTSKEKIAVFLVREGRAESANSFPLKGLVGKLVTAPAKQQSYLHLIRKNQTYREAGISATFQPVFLQPIDREASLKAGWGYARFFYLLMLVGWGITSVVIFFRKPSETTQ